MTPSRHTLSAENICKRYKKRTVVHDVSLTLNSGEIVGLLGSNGAGKTTSFYMIVGLIGCDAGRILLNDYPITHLPIHRRARLGIGYLPQEASIFRKLSTEENINAILELRSDLNREAQAEELERLLEEFNIIHIRHSLGMSLSGGERRRVEIARALASNPRFILLDEPFAGVDPISVADIQAMIRQLQRNNIGILITDHNVRETLSICERGYIVGEGRVVAAGTPTELLANSTVQQTYLGAQFAI
ncbi:LPS export ABC transporter ATP-binding protein [Ectothiorhodospiraceae bacterium BW-2]|nr:LPS export ABC transporter ATP-binding protein [Ectothiorhodospiraceae bacterium BW-2]